MSTKRRRGPAANQIDTKVAALPWTHEVASFAPPTPSVSPRQGAVVDPTMLHLVADAAVKHNTFPSRPGYPSGRAHWETHLHTEVWVRNTTYEKSVWLDLHVYGHDGALVHSETLPLHYTRPAGDGGDVFVFDGTVYEGAVATPGSVTPRPDVRALHYRVYCQLDGEVFTDGELHRCELKPDSASVV